MAVNAPSTPTISNFSRDTGTLGDHITSATQPTLIITADAGTLVQVFNGETFLGNAQESQVAGVFSFTPSAVLAGGDYHFSAVSVNLQADTSSQPSTAFDLTIDPTPPAAPTINDVVNNSGDVADHTTNDTTPTLLVEAEAGSTVTIYQDGVSIGTATELSRPGAFIFSIASDLADGSYTFSAKAADVAGNVGVASGDFIVVIDHTAPDAPTISGFSDDSGTTGDNITNDTTPTLTINAEHGSTVEVFNGETSLGFATETEKSGVFEFTVDTNPAPTLQALVPIPLGDQVLHLTAVATDVAGNQSGSSEHVDLTIDTTPPSTPSFTGFDDNSGSTEDSLTSDTTPTLHFEADSGVTVTVLFNGESVGTATEDPDNPGVYSFTSEELIDGTHTFSAVATDAAGNESEISKSFDIVVDHTAPNAPVIDSVAGGTIDLHAEAGSVVDIFRDGDFVASVLADEDGLVQVVDDGYGPGVSYTATATDAAANTSATSEAVVSNHAPTLTLNGGDNIEVHVLENTTAVATFTATDVEEGSTLTYSLGDSFTSNAFTIDETTGALSFVGAPDFETPGFFSENGTYQVDVIVSDGEFTDTQTVTVVVDDVAKEDLVGTNDGERLVAANADSTITALGGDDLLITGSGNDRLDGGTGADIMVGGAGNDVYYVDNVSDQVIEQVSSFGSVTDSGGKDTVYSTISLDLNAGAQANVARGLFVFKETLQGSYKNIEQLFLRGSDNLNGFGNALDNRLSGNDGINHLVGRGGNDVITGGAGNDKLEGSEGNDKLFGGDGSDRLIGGTGKDAFVFNAALNGSTNRDIVYDFNHDEGDKLQLSKSVFGALSLGKLSADAFYAAAGAVSAHDSSDHIIYNTTSGKLYYDADGKGGDAAVLFAVVGVEDHPSLAISDFLIIA